MKFTTLFTLKLYYNNKICKYKDILQTKGHEKTSYGFTIGGSILFYVSLR